MLPDCDIAEVSAQAVRVRALLERAVAFHTRGSWAPYVERFAALLDARDRIRVRLERVNHTGFADPSAYVALVRVNTELEALCLAVNPLGEANQ
jgi:hypothetical protein